jgi:hypothetical protein
MLHNFELYLGSQVCDAAGGDEAMNKGLIAFIDVMREERWRDEVIRIDVEHGDLITLLAR